MRQGGLSFFKRVCLFWAMADEDLLGVEPLEPTRELYTFECDQCGLLQVRGVRIG